MSPWLLLLAPLASADQAAPARTVSTFCSGGFVVDTLPRSGASDLSPDTVLAVWFEGGPSCPTPVFTATLAVDPGVEVPFHVETLEPSLVQLVPDEPLADGFYIATITTEIETTEVWLEVSAEGVLPAPDGLAIERLRLRRHCENAFSAPLLRGALAVDGSGEALVQTRLSTDGVPAAWRTQTILYGGESSLGLFETAPSGMHELCLEARLVDATGAVTGEDEWCLESRSCPAPPRSSPLAFRCATTPTSGAVGLLAVAAAALARRRRR